MGRRRVQKKGPRSIDIDILLFGSSIIETQGLTIPHAALHARRFVWSRSPRSRRRCDTRCSSARCGSCETRCRRGRR